MLTTHVLNDWALDYMDLVEGSEDWLDIPIVTGKSESGKVVVLARVRNCAPEVQNAARQNDGGADCPPLLRARARSQMIDDNTLKVVMCLQRSRCVWKIQNTPDPVERKPSEYISVAMGGSESARGSSLAFSKQDRKCRHNP